MNRSFINHLLIQVSINISPSKKKKVSINILYYSDKELRFFSTFLTKINCGIFYNKVDFDHVQF